METVKETPYATEQSYCLTDDIIYTTDTEGYYNMLFLEDAGRIFDYQS